MTKYIDLHVHSNCSDGTYSPAELVQYAAKKGLRAFALTDHDTTDGIREAVAEGRRLGVEVVPGIELSTNFWGKDIHILGLGIDVENVHFQDELLRFQNSRDIRNLKMIAKLQEAGIDITYESMLTAFSDAVWTRAHFARYLLDHQYVRSMPEAFDRYLGDHAPCFVPREKVTPFQAVSLIHQGGGAAVLAHPLLYHFSGDNLEKLVTELTQAGLDGLEAIYSTNKWVDETNMTHLAKRHHLKISGGSDFHGSNKPGIDLGTGRGNLKIPYDLLEELLKRDRAD
jgi:predicted metal-dependent phosphoesterase TrpH